MLRAACVVSILSLAACKTGPAHVRDPELAVPPRPPGAPEGSAFARKVADLSLVERERRIVREVLAGNMPRHLRKLVPVTVAATLAGEPRTLTYWVTADYVAVGSRDDFFRVPLRASTAQEIADRLGCMLPTRKIVDDVHKAAVVKLAPKPFHPDGHDITSVGVFEASHRAIEAGRAGRAGLISGIKKDIVVSRKLAERPGRVAIYGWHRTSGEPIQPLSTAHTDPHVDYSHGVRLVHRRVLVDGQPRELPVLLADPVLWPLVSDEGPIGSWRYPTRE